MSNDPHDPIRMRDFRRPATGTDAPVDLSFLHRLRFTRDVFDPANPTLTEVFDAADRAPSRCVAFVDRGVAEAWPDLPDRIAAYAHGHRERISLVGDVSIVTGGEAAKNDRDVFERTIEVIHGAGICRQSFVLVIGGGAVLDAVGFGAAVAHRGVRLIRVPTTTLSQGDGGLGVKNGINAFGKKNFLGSFAVPWAVLNDWHFLDTLGATDWRAGFSEAVKVGLIKDIDLFERVAELAPRIAVRDRAAAEPVIRRSAELHLEHIVSGGDPFEVTESRPLDFGHWSAHKLEQMSDFAVSHGDAVAIGVALDVVYSVRRGWLRPADADRILACLRDLGFALHHPAMDDTETLLAGLDEFREHLGGRLTIMLLHGIGHPVEVHEMDRAVVRDAVAELAERETAAGADAGSPVG